MGVEPKSPFFIVQEFISPQMCEDIVDTVAYTVPDVDKYDNEVMTVKTSELAEQMIYERFLQLIPQLEQYYEIVYKGMERVAFEWFPEGSTGEAHAENSNFLRGKWLHTKQRDLTAVLFLSDYQEQEDFEQEFEVYGGKLEFPQHKFGFSPVRGTLVVFPSDPHFINITSPVLIGDLYQARIQVAAQSAYIYDPRQFPGNYTMWFSDLIQQ
jgi:hypothetical protein